MPSTLNPIRAGPLGHNCIFGNLELALLPKDAGLQNVEGLPVEASSRGLKEALGLIDEVQRSDIVESPNSNISPLIECAPFLTFRQRECQKAPDGDHGPAQVT